MSKFILVFKVDIKNYQQEMHCVAYETEESMAEDVKGVLGAGCGNITVDIIFAGEVAREIKFPVSKNESNQG